VSSLLGLQCSGCAMVWALSRTRLRRKRWPSPFPIQRFVLCPQFCGLRRPPLESLCAGHDHGHYQGCRQGHLARAALEAIVYQTKDVVDAMVEDAAIPLTELKVDGGASVNDFLCQFMADMAQTQVQRPRVFETTALGAAYLAGLAVGFWESREEIRRLWQVDRTYEPQLGPEERRRLLEGWAEAVKSAKSWVVSS